MSEILFSEKYRPRKLQDAILPKSIKDTVSNIIDSGDVPNILFCGISGIGKTTTAKLICDILDRDYITINCADAGRKLDVVRDTLAEFCVGTSLSGKKKAVILDEFSECTPIVQDALKVFIEQYSITTSFIACANHRYKISDAMLSRFSEIEFNIPQNEKSELAKEFAMRVMNILKIENIEFDKMAIAQLVKRFFPDFRKVLNELQKFSVSKKFTMDSLVALESPTNRIVQLLKDKNFSELRKLVASTPSIDINQINKELWTLVDSFVEPKSIPMLVIIMADYNYKSAFAQDQEINIMAQFSDIMGSVTFK